ncbi:hypothetical protein BV898_04594 [Hypsibius exemplaris]|uniref:Proline-rich transmembrane protein 3/4 domain-containing protein n=1 Tax=Hypsibius exemplaris TaxID=2072580 RepID=A0A1W0X1N3_HYPEX|nr:hypothetical protein BV898_04594 [Hypsibius exemplaris]
MTVVSGHVTTAVGPATQLLNPIPFYTDFHSFWYFHIYMLSFAYFSVSFACFFTAINIKSQYPLQNLILIATVFIIFTGMFRTGFLMLDPYGAYNRLPASLLAFLYALGFPCITTTVAMTIFSIAQHCLKTEPKSFIWLIILFHFCVSITAEIIAVNEVTWRLFLQTVTAIFMIWSLSLLLLFANIRKSLHEIDSPPALPSAASSVPPVKAKPAHHVIAPQKKRVKKKFSESSAQTSFIQRRPTPKAKSKSCGTINGDPMSGSGILTIPSSSVVSLDSLESWDQFSLPGSPRGSLPVLLARPMSLPSVAHASGRRPFWSPRFATDRRTPKKKKDSLRLSSSYVNSIHHHNQQQQQQHNIRKFRVLNWRPLRKPSESQSGNSTSDNAADRETTSGGGGEDPTSDQVIHKDQDSTLINYFTSGLGRGLGGGSAERHSLTGNGGQQQRQMSSNESHASNPAVVRRNSTAATAATTKSLISARLWNFIRAHYCLLLLYLPYCGMYLYSVFKYPVDIEMQTRTTAWDWFVFQSSVRTMELMVLVCLAYIVAHVSALDSCNLRQRELLRI